MSAKDLGTGKEQKIEIKAGSGLSDDEVKNMVCDAEAHADEDRRARELAEARNNARERRLPGRAPARASWATRSTPSPRREIEAAIKDVREVARVRGRRRRSTPRPRRCRRAFHKVSEAMYQRAQEQAAARPATALGRGRRRDASEAEEDVVDAEVVDEPKG